MNKIPFGLKCWAGLLAMVFLCALAHGQSSSMNSSNLWQINQWYDIGCQLGDEPQIFDDTVHAEGNFYWHSPRAAADAVAAYCGGSVQSITASPNGGPLYFVNIAGVPDSGCMRVMQFGIVYTGTNFGTVCTDGSYMDGGSTCDCASLPQDKLCGGPRCGCTGDLGELGLLDDLNFCGDPINIPTGNMFVREDDYHTIGDNPLRFVRYYNSLGNTNSIATWLGKKWRSNFDRYLRLTMAGTNIASVIAERPDGQELTFTPADSSGTNWQADADVDVKLSGGPAVWTLTDSDDSVESYASGATTAQLTSITSRNGYEQWLIYSGNQLLSVSDSFNRSLQFTYTGSLLQNVLTPGGLVIHFRYTSSGQVPGVDDRLLEVDYSTSPATSRSYLYENSSFPFALTGLIDENTNRFGTWTYDSAGRATSSYHPGGAGLAQIAYNDSDGSRTVTNSLGGVSLFKFQTVQNVPKIVEIDRLPTATVPAAKRVFSYDSNGYVNSDTDWNANDTGLSNDAHGQPTSISEAFGSPVGRTTSITYATNFHLPTLIYTVPESISIGYDLTGNPLSIRETDQTRGDLPSRSWTNTFDSFGHLLTITGPRTDLIATTSFAYDGSNDLVTVTDALNHVTQLTGYSGSGLPSVMIDPNGVTNLFAYDARDRLLTRTILAASGNTTNSFAYDPAGNLRRITLPDGSYLQYSYDAANRLQAVSDADNGVITFWRDTAGDITNQLVTGNNIIYKTQNAVFDEVGRMLQLIGASSQTTSYVYDNNGNALFITDGLTNKTTRAFDALNRLKSSIDPLQNTSGFGYDSQDNLTSVTDPRNLVTGYVRNGFGQVIQEISPDKGTTTYLLDEAGNRTNEVDARGVVTLRSFDKLNRVISETFPASPGENITYTYDSTNGGNFGVGHLTGYTDETGSTALMYNERGDVVSETRTIGGHAYTTGYTYDLADRIIAIAYPSGHTFSYIRDALGRVSRVNFGPLPDSPALASNFGYLPFGLLNYFTYGNRLVFGIARDKDLRVTGISTFIFTNGVPLQYLQFGYNAANDITTITDVVNRAFSQTFSYDADYRLTNAAGIYGSVGYSYDGNGNRLSRTTATGTEVYGYSTTANQLQSITGPAFTRTFGYTASGNTGTDSRGGLTFGYGNRNRYNSLTIGGNVAATYKYNTLGERLIKTAGGVTTHFHYDRRGHLIAETKPDGTLIREYVWLGDMPLAQVEGNGNIYYIHPDQLNRPQKMTDSTGAVVWDNEQQPFGENLRVVAAGPIPTTNGQFIVTAGGGPNSTFIIQTATNLNGANWVSVATNSTPFFTSGAFSNAQMKFYRVLAVTGGNAVTNNLRFPGQYFDAESGLNYNFMRDYDATLGRYIENDPIGLRGGINPFSYVKNLPLQLKDPFGLMEIIGNIPPEEFIPPEELEPEAPKPPPFSDLVKRASPEQSLPVEDVPSGDPVSPSPGGSGSSGSTGSGSSGSGPGSSGPMKTKPGTPLRCVPSGASPNEHSKYQNVI